MKISNRLINIFAFCHASSIVLLAPHHAFMRNNYPVMQQTRPTIFSLPLLCLQLAAVLFLFAGTGLSAQPLAADSAVTVTGMKIEAVDARKSRFTVTLSRFVEAKTFVIERPDRVVIELPETHFPADAKANPGKGGMISAVRYGLFAPGRSRIILEISNPSAIRKTVLENTPDGEAELVVELTRTDRDAFHKAALADAIANARQPVTSSLAPVAADDRRPLIVLDPGHGGIDSGARTGDILEKDIVFSFAKTLKDMLDSEGKYRVMLTRDSDTFVSLNGRVALARAMRADLFISIHADTISTAQQVRGLTVYTGSEKATDAESARLAERENKADAVGGIEVAQAPEDIADILQELTMRETRSFSNRLAGVLVAHLDKVMPLNKNPHREAGFRVLRAPDIPSALIELGYMSSSKDIDLLMSEEWRSRSAEALVKALNQYFGVRTAN